MAAISMWCLIDLALTGRVVKALKTDLKHGRDVDIYYNHYLGIHQMRARLLYRITIITILIVEVLGRWVLHGINNHSLLFWVHILLFAGPFAILLLLIGVWFNGNKNKLMHRRLNRWCIATGMGTNILGVMLTFTVH